MPAITPGEVPFLLLLLPSPGGGGAGGGDGAVDGGGGGGGGDDGELVQTSGPLRVVALLGGEHWRPSLPSKALHHDHRHQGKELFSRGGGDV